MEDEAWIGKVRLILHPHYVKEPYLPRSLQNVLDKLAISAIGECALIFFLECGPKPSESETGVISGILGIAAPIAVSCLM